MLAQINSSNRKSQFMRNLGYIQARPLSASSKMLLHKLAIRIAQLGLFMIL